MKRLKHIFGSEPRVKIMRLFLFNEGTPYDVEEVATRSKVQKKTARKEINVLHKINFLHKRKYTKQITLKPLKKDKKKRTKKKKVQGWVLNEKFALVEPLRTLLIESNLVSTKEFPKRFKQIGQLKLLVLSGVFVRDDARSVDVLMVGKNLKRKKIQKTMKDLEAEIGKEIRYAVFEESEFLYRMDMYDKLLRDVFDYHHKKVVNKMKIDL